MRESWRRWHVWLGWIAGVPLLLWSLSGLVMAARPLAEIRSEMHLRAPADVPTHLIAPQLPDAPVKAVELHNGPAGGRWSVIVAGGREMAFDARTGLPLDRLSAVQASSVARVAYKGSAGIEQVSFVGRQVKSHEFPRQQDAWRVKFADGMRIYVDAWNGEVLVARSRWWSIYDAAWAIHIMDIQGRDDPNNPWIIMLGLLTTAMVVGALALLPKATRRLLGTTEPSGEI